MSFTKTLTNQTHTINGAAAFTSTNSAVLDLFSMGVSSKDKEELIANAFGEDPILAIKAAIYLRDIREGQGNRDIFRSLINSLLNLTDEDNNLDKDVGKLILIIFTHTAEFGRWKDIIEFIPQLPSKLKTAVFEFLSVNLSDGLLCKWLPRQGLIAKEFANYLKLSHGDYRRKIVANSKTVEQQMCAREWGAINYSHVPSIANHKYNAAFLKNDTARRKAFLEKAVKGEVKINSSVLYPHTIYAMLERARVGNKMYSDNTAANALWAQLPNYMTNASNVLPIIDTSGSMFCRATGTTSECIDIAAGLGIYFATHNTGSYKNLWMNFSTTPKAYYLKGETLTDYANSLDYNNWAGTTDLDKAMEFVLKAAIKAPEDAPKTIIIVSDMEFNGCTRYTSHDKMKQLFAEANIEMPVIIFWRVNVSIKQQPVTMNEKGVILINGYSPVVLKEILSGDMKNYSPYNAMLKVIEPKYPWVNEAFTLSAK